MGRRRESQERRAFGEGNKIGVGMAVEQGLKKLAGLRGVVLDYIKIWGVFNFVISGGGSRFMVLHLALLSLPLFDGKFPSENRRKLPHPKSI